MTKMMVSLAALALAGALASASVAQDSGGETDGGAGDGAARAQTDQASGAPGGAEQDQPAEAQTAEGQGSGSGQSGEGQEDEALRVYFGLGSAEVASDQRDVLERAARLYREGNPYVMVLAGGADTVGPPDMNLELSLARARTVADALAARGIPVERLQVLGRGNSDLAVDTGDGVANQENRVVEITWRLTPDG